MTSLIQNYVSFQADRKQLKPLPGKGKLVSGSIFNAPKLMLEDIAYDARAFKHAASGKANDHELGRLNNVGVKLGSLAIAGYLFTRKQTPLTKGMEFVGLASFLASMAIWPKVAIQLPAYLIHGVNVQKQYEDSFGRKKSFYQDPQFIPWDLYSDEEIHKIGDKLGVSRDIPNRRDFIQEKMRKIAVQNNTLWMLTAGFAAPVMSALICNQTEPYLNKFLTNKLNKKADFILNNFEDYSQKFQNKTTESQLETIFEKFKGKPINENVKKEIYATFFEGMDMITEESIEFDLHQILKSNSFIIDENIANEISKNFTNILNEYQDDKKAVNEIAPDKQTVIRLLQDNDYYNKAISNEKLPKLNTIFAKYIINQTNKFNKTAENKIETNIINSIIFNSPQNNHPIKTALAKSGDILEPETCEQLLKTAKAFDHFRKELYTLDDYVFLKVGDSAETTIANYWPETQQKLIKAFGFTPKEIEQARYNRDILGQILRNKVEKIVSDDNAYKKLIGELATSFEELHTQINPKDAAANLSNNGNTKYSQKVDSVFDSFANILREQGLAKTADAINHNDNIGTLKNIQKTFIANKLLGVESTLNRLINTLSFYRKVATDPNNMPTFVHHAKEVKEELIELCKTITLQGHSSDFANKFYKLRNNTPSENSDPLEVKNGKLTNTIHKPSTGVDIPDDKYFYQDAMKLMFGNDVDEETLRILEDHKLKDSFLNYREQVWSKLGGEYNFARPYHRVANTQTPSDIKFLLTGVAPDEYFHKGVQKAFNSTKWLKMFGGFGAGLLGITILSQFFFGKLKEPRRQK